MYRDKVDELITALKAYDFGKKKEIVVEEKKSTNPVVVILAVIGAIVAVAGIAYAVYRYFTPDYLDDFEDEFDDEEEFEDDDFFEDETGDEE